MPNTELCGAFRGCRIRENAGRSGMIFSKISRAGRLRAGLRVHRRLELASARRGRSLVAEPHPEISRHFAERKKLRRFAGASKRTFALRWSLRSLPRPDGLPVRSNVVTQCLAQHSWRAAKLETEVRYGALPRRAHFGSVSRPRCGLR